MPSPIPCTQCCTTPQTVNIPGVEGDPGVDGTDGLNAYTTLTANLTVPAVSANVTASVVSSAWMVVGQIVVLGAPVGGAGNGPATFQVAALPDTTSATLTFLGYPSDVAPATVLIAGTQVTPAGELSVLTDPEEVDTVGAGATRFEITDSAAQVNIDSTAVEVTLPSDGTYLLFARLRVDSSSATLTTQTLTAYLYKTGAPAGAVPNATTTFILGPITTTSKTFGTILIPIVSYVGVAAEKIQMFAVLSAAAGAGNIYAVEAEILAQLIHS